MPASIGCGQNRCYTQINILLDIFAPEPEHNPTFCFQSFVYELIALSITFNLAMPELNVGLVFELSLTPVLTVPKFTIGEYGNSQAPEGEVRLSKDSSVILSISKTVFPESFTEAAFYHGTRTPNCPHVFINVSWAEARSSIGDSV